MLGGWSSSDVAGLATRACVGTRGAAGSLEDEGACDAVASGGSSRAGRTAGSCLGKVMRGQAVTAAAPARKSLRQPERESGAETGLLAWPTSWTRRLLDGREQPEGPLRQGPARWSLGFSLTREPVRYPEIRLGRGS